MIISYHYKLHVFIWFCHVSVSFVLVRCRAIFFCQHWKLLVHVQHAFSRSSLDWQLCSSSWPWILMLPPQLFRNVNCCDAKVIESWRSRCRSLSLLASARDQSQQLVCRDVRVIRVQHVCHCFWESVLLVILLNCWSRKQPDATLCFDSSSFDFAFRSFDCVKAFCFNWSVLQSCKSYAVVHVCVYIDWFILSVTDKEGQSQLLCSLTYDDIVTF